LSNLYKIEKNTVGNPGKLELPDSQYWHRIRFWKRP